MPDVDYQTQVREWYGRKYANRKLDLIVTIGPEAHKFIQTEHARLFGGVPVVFCFDIKTDRNDRAPDPDFTGVWMDFDPVSTVNVARRLLPATKHVVVVAGDGLFDQLFSNTVRVKLQGYQGVDFTYLTDIDLPSLLAKVRSLSQDSIILYLTVTKVRHEQHLFALLTLPLVSNAANVPVFGMADLMIGRGIVGGHVTNVTDVGPLTADIAFRILQGAMPQTIPEITGANRYAFDWKQLKQWGLETSNLPAGSAVLNRGPSMWDQYRTVILAAVFVVILLSALVAYLLIERIRRLRTQQALETDIVAREKAEAALTDLSIRLIDAQEEERSRIARELHDDFSQRLAVMAIDLKRLANISPLQSEEAVQRINLLHDQTCDVGADLHKMSHNLHSSTMELLGLEEGVQDLCHEFERQQGLEIELIADGIPRTLSQPISLCLFRVVQEALNNAKKHSGATEVVVQLHGSAKEIVLSIVDAGNGFNQSDLSFKAGLGLQSMRERLRAVGGTFEIDSISGGGTQILARAPLP
jgi:signal transduction histidine kinase